MSTLAELLEKRKNKKSTTESETPEESSAPGEDNSESTTSLAELLERRKIRNAYGSTEQSKGYSDWLKRVNELTEGIFSDYTARDGKYQSAEDFEKYYSEKSAQIQGLLDEGQLHYGYFSQYGDAYDEYYEGGFKDNFLANYESLTKYLTNVNDNLASENQMWSQFANEKEYNDAIAAQELQTELASMDIAAAKAEVEQMKAELSDGDWYVTVSAAKQRIAFLETQLAGRQWFEGRDEIEQEIAQLKATVYGVKAHKSRITELESKITLAQRVQAIGEFEMIPTVSDPNSEHYDPESDNYDPDFYAYVQSGLRRDEAGENLNLGDGAVADTLENALSKYTVAYLRNNPLPGAIKFILDNVKYANPQVDELLLRYKAAQYMKEDEFNAYCYYRGKDEENGTNTADEYLWLIRERLYEREGNKIAEGFKDKPTIVKQLYSVVAGADQFSSGMKGLSVDGYTPTSSIQYASAAIRKDLADEGIFRWYNFKTKKWEDKFFGSSSAQAIYDIGSTTANMLPTILVSVAIEAALPTIGEGLGVGIALNSASKIGAAAGASVLGLSAAGNAKVEMLNLGYSKEQANAYAVLIGASEAGLSYLMSGIPGLRGGDGVVSGLATKVLSKVDNALAKVAIAFGGVIDEGVEEGLQTILETWFKEVVTGADFEDPTVDEVLYSSLLGMLSAAGFSVGNVGVNHVSKQISIDAETEKYGQSVINQGMVAELQASAAKSSDNKTIARLSGKVAKKATAKNVGKLALSLSHSQMSLAIQSRLGEDSRAVADTITDAIMGRDVSNRALRAVMKNDGAIALINETLGTNFTKDSSIGDVRKAFEGSTGTKASKGKQQGSEAKISDQSPAKFSVAESESGGFDVIAEGNGESIVIMHYDTQGQAQAAAYAQTLKMGGEGLKGLVSLAEGLSEGVDLGEAALAFNALYNQGKKGVAMIAAENASLLSPYQREMAYQAGVVDGIFERSREKSSSEVLQNDAVDGTIENDDAIWRYKSSESYKINEAIRSERELTAEELEFIEELDKELSRVPKFSGVVYRNMTFDFQGQEELDAFVAGHSVGDIVTYPAYTSTSKSKEGYVVEGEFLVHLEIYGENGHDVSKGYGIEEEQEVLFKRNTDFYVSSVSYDGKVANIVLEEIAYEEKGISEINKRNNSAQQGHNSESGTSEVQQMQSSEQMDMQKVSQRNTEDGSPQRNELRGVRGEVSSDVDLDVQQAKENAIGHERVVYSSRGAMAYDAVSEDHLNTAQKRAVDVGLGIGIKVVVADTRSANGSEVDGFIGKDGTIYISKNNVSPVAFVFKHELSHFCERSGQKYQDFVNAARKSTEFKNWLKQKGMTELEYNAQIRRERREIGPDPGEFGATMEIMANFVGDVMFGDNNTIANDLIAALKPKERRSFKEFLRDFFDWIKSKFVGKNNVARTEIHKLEKMFGEAFRTAVNVQQRSGEQFAFNDSFGQQLRDWQKGNGKATGTYNGRYFKLGTTPEVLTKHGAPSGEVIMFEDCLLKITGQKHSISLDELAKIPSQLNDPILLFKGSVENSFVALTEIKDKLGNDVIVAVHINKKMGRSVINKITSVYSKTDDFGNNKINNYVSDQIRKGNLLDASTKKAPNWFTTSGLQLPHVVQTILDANNSISQKSEKSTENSKKFSGDGGESFSYTSRSEATANARRAIEEFGVTGDFDMTGFVLEDGQMLKLSPYGLKGVNHSLIGKIYDDVKGSAAVNRFIQEGNVRIKASSPGIEIGAQIAPSVSQYNMISRFISRSLRSKGVFYLDITDASGNEVDSVFYDDRNSTEEIIYDIKDFYRNGRIRRNDIQFSYTPRGNNTTETLEIAKEYGVSATNDQLAENAHKVVNMSNVAVLNGTEFAADGKTSLKEKVVNFFDSVGNKVITQEIGEVLLTRTSFSDDKGHGLTKNKIVSFKAIPEVLQNGRLIDIYKPEGKPYIRIIVAAPITITGEKFYMGVMVQKDKQSSRMYLHDVITEKATLSLSNGANRQNSEGIRDEGHLFITSILQKRLNVNRLDEIFYQKNENFDQDRYKNRNSMSSGGSNSSNISPRNNTVSNNSISQKSKKSTDNSKKIADDDRNQYSYTSRKDSVDNYTEKQYNDFGWVRDNDVISAGYWKNFTENFAQAVAGKSIYPKTKNGEYMINVYDVYESDGISDVVVFASGTIESPNVTRIVKIDSNNSEEIDRARRNIYESARRGIQQEAGELFRFYNKADFVSIGYGKEKGSSGIGYNSRDGYRGRSSKTSKRIKELKINDDGSFVTVYSDGSVETTGPSDSNQYSYTSRKDSVDNYTEKQYNDFGWVRDNDVINAGYWKNFTENFAQAVNHPHNDKYSTTPNGAYIIPIYDANLNDIDAVIDTIVVAEGTIDSPVVLKVIKINASHDIDMKVREIDEAERRGIYTKTSELQNVYYSTNFRHQRYDHGKSYENDGNNVELGVYRGRSSKTSKRIKELKINDDGSFVTVYSDGSVETTGPSDSNQYSYTSRQESVETIFERAKNGEISLDEAERQVQELLSKKGDDPISIADLQPDDMNTTPRLNKRTKGKHGDGDSKFAESLYKSKIFNEDFKAEVKDDNFVKHYASITNKETLSEAAQRLDEGGEAYVKEWLAKKTEHMDTVDTMVGFILLKRYQDVGDYVSAAAVAQRVREVGTISGQRVQAFSIISRFDADMMQVYAQKELDKAWELAIKDRSQKWIDKHAAQFKLTDEEIAFIRNNILYAAKMPENSRERAIALAQITTLIQNKIPPVKGQSYKAWQRISMLLNPRTQLRNVLGNALMAPVFIASDWFSAPIDKLISKKTGVRTTGLTGLHGSGANLKAFKKGLFESCDDFRRHINTKSENQNRFEIGQGKSFDETKWGRIAKIMNGFDRFTSFLLDAGDRPFYEMWFTNSLNEQMRLNKVSEPTEDMVQIAVDEALSRTWQDENKMTKLVSGIKKSANQLSIGGYGVGDVIIKFTKTPANLTKAIYDFSPAAILSITPQAVRLANAIKRGTVTPSMQKNFVSNIGKMAAGTMLYVAFAALYAAGRITGSSDEDKDVAAFEKYVQGIPAYSIKIGDKWFSYDWAQPIGAVPAIIADFMEAKEEGSGGAESVLSAFKAGGEVLFNQSFMSSLQTLFAADSFAEGFLGVGLGEVSVPVPTIFSQLSNVFDDKRRVTYDSTSEFKSALNRAMLKIPGLRNLLEAEVDVLGREVDNSQKNWFNAFFNPANAYTDTSTDVTDHAYEIYQSTGDVGAIPSKAPYSVKLQGKTVRLDDVQRAQYQRVMGETASDLIEILLDNDVYNAMNDEEKLAVLKQVYSYSASVAKSQLEWANDYEVVSGIVPYMTKKEFNGMSYEERRQIVEDYIFSDYDGMEAIESEEGQANFIINKKTPSLVLSATISGDVDEAVKLIGGIQSRVESYGWDEEDTDAEVEEKRSDVKKVITRYWKEAYLYAYYTGNDKEQERIIDMLVALDDLYGDLREVKKTVKNWIKVYEESD